MRTSGISTDICTIAIATSGAMPTTTVSAPRSFAILNGTLSAAVGLGLRLWIAGLVLWLAGHAVAVWVTRKDPAFLTVLSRHARHKGALSC